MNIAFTLFLVIAVELYINSGLKIININVELLLLINLFFLLILSYKIQKWFYKMR